MNKPHEKTLQEALAWQDGKKRHILTQTDPLYPKLLKEIIYPPPMLFIYGNKEVLSTPQVAMVGSRKPSYSGLETATQFAYELACADITITSGLAIGIDTASHEGALAASGKTIAVLACGLDHLYPKQNSLLAEKIAESGCLVSEWPLHTRPLPAYFPRRNRIISGLSLGTLVVEAALKSGSLITARFALEQNREVFAIPGSIHSATASGTLSLIKQGATCVTCVNDILEELDMRPQISLVQSSDCTKRSLDPASAQVLACIENDPISVDQICARSKLSAHLVTSTLLKLELENMIRLWNGGYIQAL